MQIPHNLSESHLLGVIDGNATPGANYFSIYCAPEVQHLIIRMIKRLVFTSSIMDLLMIRHKLINPERAGERFHCSHFITLLSLKTGSSNTTNHIDLSGHRLYDALSYSNLLRNPVRIEID